MNNHILQKMSLDEAKVQGFKAINCWKNNIKNENEASTIINQFILRIETLVDMTIDSGQWIIMRHVSGAVFPVLIPDGQRNIEGWEGLSMSVSHVLIKEMLDENPFWHNVYDDLDKAVLGENLEISPFLS